MAREQRASNSGFNFDNLTAGAVSPKDKPALQTPQSSTNGRRDLVTIGLLALATVVGGCAAVDTIAQTPQTPGTGPDAGGAGSNTGDPTATPETPLQLFDDVLNATPQQQIAIVTFDPATFQGSATEKAQLQAEHDAFLLQLKTQESGWMLYNNSAPMVDPYNENGQNLVYDHGIILNEVSTSDGSQYWLVATVNPADSSKMIVYILDQGNSTIWYGAENSSTSNGDQDNWGSGTNLKALQPVSQYDVMSRTKGRVVNIVIWQQIPSFQSNNENGHPDMAAYDTFERAHLTANQQLAAILEGKQPITPNNPFIISSADQLNKIDPATLQANASKYPGSAWVIEPSWPTPTQ